MSAVGSQESVPTGLEEAGVYLTGRISSTYPTITNPKSAAGKHSNTSVATSLSISRDDYIEVTGG